MLHWTKSSWLSCRWNSVRQSCFQSCCTNSLEQSTYWSNRLLSSITSLNDISKPSFTSVRSTADHVTVSSLAIHCCTDIYILTIVRYQLFDNNKLHAGCALSYNGWPISGNSQIWNSQARDWWDTAILNHRPPMVSVRPRSNHSPIHSSSCYSGTWPCRKLPKH